MVEPEVEELHADQTARLAVLGGDDMDDINDESVAMDTPNEPNKFDFTSLHGVSKAAFDEQTIARVFCELEGATPKLGELGIYLKQCTSLKQPQDRDCASAFHNTLSSLQRELSCLLNGYEMSGSVVGPSHPPPPSSLAKTSPPPAVTQPSGSQHHGHKWTVFDWGACSPFVSISRPKSIVLTNQRTQIQKALPNSEGGQIQNANR
ncbi:hypothetical protein PILCRDRAFT_730 [Piloderma croceum F 1598]|uniref:Uncharacterized protein n=1 Tax=Piloderma croceum (strain F 1598) TaxID=765440 RepID=A0A0C3CPB0_PILCF|nr:hypothetical protein PILCRDRAFT_730 [Piloderma croceum F 1598]